ncbi:MAG: hypothetical protein RI897_3701 [Verrucomicrobiota bacterium]
MGWCGDSGEWRGVEGMKRICGGSLVLGFVLGVFLAVGGESGAGGRAEVVVVEHPGATVRFAPQMGVVSNMVMRGVMAVTGEADGVLAWRRLVATNETVGIKVFSRPGAISGTRPPVVEAVVQGLIGAGLPATNIVIWDRHYADLRMAGYVEMGRKYGVRVAGSNDAGYEQEVFYETPLIGKLVWGDVEFGQTGAGVGRKSFASQLVASGFQKIISVVPLLNNNETAVSGHCWGLAMSSTDNTLRFENTPGRMAEAVPELLALAGLDLRDRLVLAITDAMLCQYQGEERQLLHYSTVLDQLWFGMDPVAMDVMAVEVIERERRQRGLAGKAADRILYENCSLLELGVSATNRIDMRMLQLAPRVGREGVLPAADID